MPRKKPATSELAESRQDLQTDELPNPLAATPNDPTTAVVGTNHENEQTETPPGAAAPGKKRGRQTAAPTCPYCDVKCKARHTDAYFTRYYCPVPGCGFSHKQPRPALRTRLHDPPESWSAR